MSRKVDCLYLHMIWVGKQGLGIIHPYRTISSGIYLGQRERKRTEKEFYRTKPGWDGDTLLGEVGTSKGDLFLLFYEDHHPEYEVVS